MSEIGNLIKEICQNTVEQSKPVNILYGAVETVDPLSIRIDQKLVIKEKNLILTNAVRDYAIKTTFDNPNIKQVFTTWDMEETNESIESKISFKQKIQHEITVYNKLSVGEKVILIRAQEGQKFIVLDRLEG